MMAAASTPIAAPTRHTSIGVLDGAAVRRSVTSVPKRRGWLVRRMLALADVVGLTTAIVAVTTARAGARAFCRRRLEYVQNTVIVGAGTVGQVVARKLLQHREYGVNVVGLVDVKPRERLPGLQRLPLLGRPAELREIVRHYGVERVIFAFSDEPGEQTVAVVRSIKDLDVQIDIVPRLYELVGPSADIFTVEGIPLVGLPPLRLSRRAKLLKRALDLVVSTVGLVLLAPAVALIALLIRLDSDGPVLFWQPRVGTGGRVFRMAKFRTMCRDAEERKCELRHLNRHAH